MIEPQLMSTPCDDTKDSSNTDFDTTVNEQKIVSKTESVSPDNQEMEMPLDKKIEHNDSKDNESVTYESSSEQKPTVINIATSEDDTSTKQQRKQKKSSKMLTPEEEQNYHSYHERKL